MALIAAALSGAASPAPAAADGMVLLPGGRYAPFFVRKQSRPVTVAAFRMDVRPVTNAEFQAFVDLHPEWRKSAIPEIFAEPGYLAHWQDDLSLRPGRGADQPVTNVSWFAARAYCAARGARLPTTDQWEYALLDRGRDAAAVRDRILAWYAVPNGVELPAVGTARPNGYGVAGLDGLVWEWTEDYSAALVGPELRDGGEAGKGLFCAGGSQGARDPADYAAFMRYAFRASLKASYVTDNLGFRCAKEAAP